MTVTIEPEVPQQLARQGNELALQVQAIQVTDPVSFEEAAELSKVAATYIKRVGEVLDPIVSANHYAWQVALAQRATLLKPVEAAKKALGDRMGAWQAEQDAKRKAAEEAARRERERFEAEERARIAAEEERLRREEEDRRLTEAAAAEAAGDTARAEQLIAAPVVVPTVAPRPVYVAPPPVATPRVDGVSFREQWDFEVINPALLPREYLKVDEVKIGGVVRALKGASNIPGVRVFSRNVAATKVR